MSRYRYALLPLLALGACSNATDADRVEHDIVVELGKSVPLDSTGIRVGLRSVEDSRCPISVLCISAGDARIALDLSFAGGPEVTGELSTAPDKRQLTFRFARIALTDLEPYPVYNKPAAYPYRAHLRWSYLPD